MDKHIALSPCPFCGKEPVNAIRLGAFCQRKFHLPKTFQIHFLPPGSNTRIRLPKTQDISFLGHYEYSAIEIEDIVLEQIEVRQGGGKADYTWVGYSTSRNTLFVMKELE